MIQQDFHLHTCYSDGNHTPEEMILSALGKGFTTIGFTDHSFVETQSYCMKAGMSAAYKEEIFALKEKYRGKITILCGIEQDYYSKESTDGYEYIIGAVHEVHTAGTDCKIDSGLELQEKAIAEVFGGDSYAFVEEYFTHMANLPDCDIIAHFDLITKYQEKKMVYDETNPRYREAAVGALKALLPRGVPFEVNVGAITRGVRTTPYPAPWLLRELFERGADVMISGDCHNKDFIGYGFDLALAQIKAAGFERVVTFTATGKEYIKI